MSKRLLLLGTGLALAFLLGCISPKTQEPASTSSPAKDKIVAPVEPADNSYCFVCHVNYQEEPLALQHQEAGIGCEQCHGLSAKHSADEDNLTAPEKMYAPARVAPFCLTCHAKRSLARDPNHREVFASRKTESQRCTECHGEHRLTHRTRVWDKNTGKLLRKDGGPAMDRKN